MQIQNNYLTNYKQNPNFGWIPVESLKTGKEFLINTNHNNPLLHGTRRIYDIVEKLSDHSLRTVYRELKTGERGEYCFAEKERYNAIMFLDEIV